MYDEILSLFEFSDPDRAKIERARDAWETLQQTKEAHAKAKREADHAKKVLLSAPNPLEYRRWKGERVKVYAHKARNIASRRYAKANVHSFAMGELEKEAEAQWKTCHDQVIQIMRRISEMTQEPVNA